MKKERFVWGDYRNVAVAFWVVKPFDNREIAQAFLEIVEGHCLAPDMIDTGWEKSRYRPLKEHLHDYYRGWLELPPREISKLVHLRRTTRPRGFTMCSVDATGNRPFDILDTNLEVDYFREESHQQHFVQMARHVYSLVDPAYAILEYSDTRHAKTGPIGLGRGLPGIFWGNFLGPDYSAMVGWDRLQALARELPVTAERLPDDGVLILLGGNVLDSGSPEMLARAEAVEHFLGTEYFSKTQPSRPLPFSLEDVEAGRVPPELLRQTILRPPPPQGKVPAFRFQESRRERQAEWARSGGMTVEEVAADLGLELKGPGGVIMVDAATGRGVDLPGRLFEDKPEDTEQDE
jgi:hypothetical protein